MNYDKYQVHKTKKKKYHDAKYQSDKKNIYRVGIFFFSKNILITSSFTNVETHLAIAILPMGQMTLHNIYLYYCARHRRELRRPRFPFG